ncbi:MAG: flagellar biosynthetic protein FliR [Actinomycetota bacterium]
MEELLQGLAPQALVFLLIAARLSAMMAVAPFFSARSLPMRAKAGLVVLASYVLLPVVGGQAALAADVGAVEFGLLVGKEVLIGLAFGLVAQMLFAAVQVAGGLIDISAGFAIASVIDPTSNLNITVLGRYYNLVATASFLAIGGHQWLVAGIADSFRLAPPTDLPDLDAIVSGVIGQADDILLVALMIGAPILVALFVSDIALGILARAVPQMNVFIVGLPLKVVLALAGIAILLPTTMGFVGDLTGRMLSDLNAMLGAAGG